MQTTIQTANGTETINVTVDLKGLRKDLGDRMVIEWRGAGSFVAGPHLGLDVTEAECVEAVRAFAVERLDEQRPGARVRMLAGSFVAVPMSQRNHR